MSFNVALILVSVLAYGLVQAVPLPSTNPCQDVMRMIQNGQNAQEIREVLLKSASGRGYKPSYSSGNNYYNNDDSYGDYSNQDYYSGNNNDNYYSGNGDDYYSGNDDYYSGNGDDYYSDNSDSYYDGDSSPYYSNGNSYSGSTYSGSGSNYYSGSTYSNGNSYYSGKNKGKKGKKPQYNCAGESCRKQKGSKGKAGKKSEDGSRLVEEFLRMTGLTQEQSGAASAVLQQCSQLPAAPTFGAFLQSLRNVVAAQ
ncbi:uncharacterized protein LOC141856953 [Brevipalpus obovatus]|uniref:uncharacterized protein LOC141856953 n=1 Tax=Brevipalpus obovatus TaxID=246614 RepID=UPI003D9DD388